MSADQSPRDRPTPCEHYSVMRLGDIRCAKCGALYLFGLGGARWVEPQRSSRRAA